MPVFMEASGSGVIVFFRSHGSLGVSRKPIASQGRPLRRCGQAFLQQGCAGSTCPELARRGGFSANSQGSRLPLSSLHALGQSPDGDGGSTQASGKRVSKRFENRPGGEMASLAQREPPKPLQAPITLHSCPVMSAYRIGIGSEESCNTCHIKAIKATELLPPLFRNWPVPG